MPRADAIKLEGHVVAALPNAVYRVALPNGHQMLARVPGKMRLHLARMDAKEKWQELETQFSSLEHRLTADGGTLLGSSAQLAKELKQSLVEFRQRLSPEPEASTHASSR